MDANTLRRLRRIEDDLARLQRKPSVDVHKFGALMAAYQALPGMRGFWPLSSLDAGNNPSDISGQERHLTNNGTATPGTHNDLIPTISLNGTSQYLSRPSEAGLTITGAFTALAWVKFNALGVAGVSHRPVMGKSPNGTNHSWWFAVDANSAGAMVWNISNTGSVLISLGTPSGVIEIGNWYFLAMRYTPSSELKGWVMEAEYILTTGVPASLFNNSGAFEIGRVLGTHYTNGVMALPWLGAQAVPDRAIERIIESGRGLFGV